LRLEQFWILCAIQDGLQRVRRQEQGQLNALGRDLPHQQFRQDLVLGYRILEVIPSLLSSAALLVEKNVMFYLLFFIMIVAAFGIMNSLITFVVQKTREIGMLKALGATRGQVLWLFLSQSLMVGVVGVVTGFGLGMLAVAYRNPFLHFMNRLTGFELFPASIYSFAELPALIIPGDIALICGSALIICVLAGLIPAWNAGRLQPVAAWIGKTDQRPHTALISHYGRLA
jgi:lipoprotein-releasing system permease protein